MVYEIGRPRVAAQLMVGFQVQSDGRPHEEQPFLIGITGERINEDLVFAMVMEAAAFCVAVARKLYAAGKHEEGAPEELDAEQWIADLYQAILERWRADKDGLLGKVAVVEPQQPKGPKGLVI